MASWSAGTAGPFAAMPFSALAISALAVLYRPYAFRPGAQLSLFFRALRRLHRVDRPATAGGTSSCRSATVAGSLMRSRQPNASCTGSSSTSEPDANSASRSTSRIVGVEPALLRDRRRPVSRWNGRELTHLSRSDSVGARPTRPRSVRCRASRRRDRYAAGSPKDRGTAALRRASLRSHRKTRKPGMLEARERRAHEIGHGAEILGDDLRAGAAKQIEHRFAERSLRRLVRRREDARRRRLAGGRRCDRSRRGDRCGSRRRDRRCAARARAASR